MAQLRQLAKSETLASINAWLTEHKQPNYRMQQVRDVWFTGTSWDSATSLPLEVREELRKQFPWLMFKEAKVFTSPKDGTKKALLTLQDGKKIETVNMPNARGTRTVCISSQIGCAMACTFCATGKMGLMRNLSVDEIIDQVRFWKNTEYNPDYSEDEPITNIVFMGMGEPLANYHVVKEVAKMLINDIGLGATRITVSTVGVPTGLKLLLTDDDFPPVRIALSIHAGTDETRQSIVPTHKAHTIKRLAEWAREYIALRGNRRHHLTLEYVMLQDTNDMLTEAKALAKEFGQMGGKIKLNLIPWNPTGTHLQRSTQDHLAKFQSVTEQAGIPTTIRYSKGLDIDAACGQLVIKEQENSVTG